MRVFMIGEAANHREKLEASLQQSLPIVSLPREAAYQPDYDGEIGPDDVVISLRFSNRPSPPNFRLLHVPGAGLDGIDFASLGPSCAVCNVFEHEIPIAEFVLLAMLEWEIRLAEMRASFRPETWSDLYRARPPHGELNGQTLGIVGFGRIGRAIAARAKAFGMHIIAVDSGARDPAPADEVLRPGELGAMLGQADFAVLACPLTDETRGLMGEAEFTMMKPSAVLVNISRAEIVDEQALFTALEQRRIGGACLDVWYSYPTGATDHVLPASKPFHTLRNVIATPHSSAWTRQLPFRRYAVIAENIRRLVAGEPLRNLVRAPAKELDHSSESSQ